MVVTQDEIKIRLDLVREIKAFEAKLGWSPTKNFDQYGETLDVYRYCTHAGELDFVLLSFAVEKKDCEAMMGEGRDTTYYEVEAIAGVGTPLSRALVESSLSHFVYVVFHEDFHEQIRDIPTLALNESAAQLMSLLAGREFARKKYGENSTTYHELARNVELSLADAHIENRYYEKLTNLYDRVARGEIGRLDGFREKAVLYEQMQGECRKMGWRSTFWSCEGVTNNAVFGVSITYAAYYPLFYDLYKSCGEDTKRTGLLIMAVVGENLTEQEFVPRIEELINKGCTTRGAS